MNCFVLRISKTWEKHQVGAWHRMIAVVMNIHTGISRTLMLFRVRSARLLYCLRRGSFSLKAWKYWTPWLRVLLFIPVVSSCYPLHLRTCGSADVGPNSPSGSVNWCQTCPGRVKRWLVHRLANASHCVGLIHIPNASPIWLWRWVFDSKNLLWISLKLRDSAAAKKSTLFEISCLLRIAMALNLL